MKNIQLACLTCTVVAVLTVAGFLVGAGNLQIMAAEEEDKGYTQANGVSILTTIYTHDGTFTTDNFQVFKQTSGFNREIDRPAFTLEGVVAPDKMIFYQVSDETSKTQTSTFWSKYSEIDIDVQLVKDGVVLREFNYADCEITDYKVDTLFDKEEGWNSSKGFAVIDEFDFECNGYHPNNPIYEVMNADYSESQSMPSGALKDTSTWPTSMVAP